MNLWDIAEVDAPPGSPAVLHSDEGAARVVAMRLAAGDELQEHQVHEHAWLHVHDGEVEIVQDGQTTSGSAGFLAHFEPHERHEVRATSDSTLILFLAPWPGEGRNEDFDA